MCKYIYIHIHTYAYKNLNHFLIKCLFLIFFAFCVLGCELKFFKSYPIFIPHPFYSLFFKQQN